MRPIPARLPEGNAVLADDPGPAGAAYAACGIAVFPVHGVDDVGICTCDKDCGRDAGKHPRTANGLLDATRELNIVRTWWRRWASANIGIATGPPSDIWVLDVDPAHGGLESIERLEAAHGEIPPTWCVETGGDGLHLWFRLDGAAIRSSAGRLGTGLDVRAAGGYVIAPPSRHRSGRCYHWADAWHPTLVDLAPAPPWLLDLLTGRSPQRMIPPDRLPYRGAVGGNHSGALPEVIEEGARNAALTSLAGAMRRKGAGEKAIRAALLVENAVRCRPPLPKDEVAGIARSVCRYAPVTEPSRLRRAGGTNRFVEFVDGKAVAR